MAERSVVVLSGTRTAIGTYGGSLKDVPPTRLAALALGEAVKRSKLEPAQIGQVFFGHVIHTEPRDMYLARVAGVEAGLPIDTPALTLNRLCGSGFQAIVSRDTIAWKPLPHKPVQRERGVSMGSPASTPATRAVQLLVLGSAVNNMPKKT